MTSANALAGGWSAVWRVATPKFNAEAPPASSVTATCGSTTLSGTFEYDTGHQHLIYTLPNVGNVTSKNKVTDVPKDNSLERFTYAAVCPAKSKLTVTIN